MLRRAAPGKRWLRYARVHRDSMHNEYTSSLHTPASLALVSLEPPCAFVGEGEKQPGSHVKCYFSSMRWSRGEEALLFGQKALGSCRASRKKGIFHQRIGLFTLNTRADAPR
jgi:hypothetical protein